MVVVNYSREEINAKIVYYGPGLSGKTTNLDYVYRNMPVGVKGKMVTMKTRTDRTLFFDYLPMEFGDINGLEIACCCIPFPDKFTTTPRASLYSRERTPWCLWSIHRRTN